MDRAGRHRDVERDVLDGTCVGGGLFMHILWWINYR